MKRANRKEAVAALHGEKILKAAERLFSEKGYENTSIDDISVLSEYSRRTIYAYYENKEDILYHVIEKGLSKLKNDLKKALKQNLDFLEHYGAICKAAVKYYKEYPFSAQCVDKAKSETMAFEDLSDTVKRILDLGTEINGLLTEFIQSGKERGVVRNDVVPPLTVCILWSGVGALAELWKTKGYFIEKQFSVTESEFLDYGFRQLVNSVLEERI